jgi:PAS domain S-box-containing protein
MTALRLLLLEEDLGDAERVTAALKSQGVEAELLRVESHDRALKALQSEPFDLILSNYGLPGWDGMAVLETARELRPEVPFIFVAAALGEAVAIAALTNGATDYVLKHRLERLGAAVQRSLRLAQDQRNQQSGLHHQIETALQQSNDRFYRAMRAVQGIVFEWNLQTKLVYRSEGLFQLIGVRAEDAPPTVQWWLERMHPDDRDQLEAGFSALATGTERYETEYRVWHEAGGWVDVWERGYLQWNLQGEVTIVVGFTTDISDRKRVEAERERIQAELRQKTAILDVINESVPTPIFVKDRQGRIIYANPATLAVLGRPAAEVIGYYDIDLYPNPEDAADVMANDRRIMESGELEVVEESPDGVRTFLGMKVPYRNEAGEVVGLIGIANDITERKRAEEALQQNEARLRLIIESAKDYAIFTLTLDGIIASWNSGAERLLGYAEAEAIGCSGSIIFTAEDVEQGRPDWEIATALAQGRAENERWHVRQDGSRFWASGLMTPLVDEAGQPQGFVKILQDKTAQKQAGDRLRLLYETTRDLLATDQPLALMHNLFTRLTSHLDLHFYYNFIVAERDHQPMLHLSNYEGISAAMAQTIEWVPFGQYFCGLVAQRQEQLVLDHQQIATHPNAGVLRDLGATAYAGQPLVVHGRLIGTLSFASRTRPRFTPAEIDLLQSTCDQVAIALERTNLMLSLQQQAEQLKRANRIKDEFLAVLSHELRSPLNPILGWARLLQTGNLNEAQQAEALKTIERNAKLQTQLIEDLLDISRIMQGKLTLTVAATSLRFVISAAVETVRLAAEANQIAIVLDSATEVIVAGDAARLQQVMWNLLSNAVKFTPPGGRVTVELRQIDRLAQIRVSDTGKGIQPTFLPHVFEYFRQEDGSTTRKFGGLGLGLAIVRQIVEMHGGAVWAESEGENCGASFTVQLPVLGAGVAGAGGGSDASNLQLSVLSAPLGGWRILLVEDDADTREFQVFLLEQSGATVAAAASGCEALEILEQFTPDLLISDIGMAEMDGYMLIQQIRRLEAANSHIPQETGQSPALHRTAIPAIALTAYAADIDQQRALQMGFQAHLTKPFEPEQLLRVIVSLLQGSQKQR